MLTISPDAHAKEYHIHIKGLASHLKKMQWPDNSKQLADR